MTALDERKAAILRAVVEEYIQTAQPVGSSRVAQLPAVQVSPATVRNEMAALERDGYLVQPHTSAGRIPTDKGYRVFVDQLATPGRLEDAEREVVRRFFNRTHGALEQMLHDTSRLLSNVTNYAAVVVGPQHEAGTIRSVQLVGLTPRTVLVVAVLSNGVVEKRVLDLDEDASDDVLADATQQLAPQLVGQTLGEISDAPVTGHAGRDAIAAKAFAALRGGAHELEPDHVYVDGTSRVAAAFDAVDSVRRVLSILEQQFVVVTLLQDLLERGLSVAIGTEVGHEALAECSVIVAPYEIEGEVAGTVGVLGPTRMNYPQALSAVALVSQRLGDRLTEG